MDGIFFEEDLVEMMTKETLFNRFYSKGIDNYEFAFHMKSDNLKGGHQNV